MAAGSKNYTVALNIIGDSTKAQKSVQDFADKTEQTTGRAGKAFSQMAGSFNSSSLFGGMFGELDKVGGVFDAIGEKSKTVSQKMLGIGAAGVGVGAMLIGIGDKDKQAQQQLAQAVENTGRSYEDYAGQVEKTIKSQEKFGHGAVDTQTALQKLTQASQDPQKALNTMGLAADLAAAKHISLSEASDGLSKVLAGKGGKTLAAFGISMKDASGHARTTDEVLKMLGDRLHGQASASADTFTGKMKALKTEIEDGAARLGQKYGPTITMASTAMMGLGTASEAASSILGRFKTVQEAGTVATEGMAAAEGTEAAASWAALGPILLIIAAVAALGIGIYELVTHWHVVWTAIKGAVGEAWHFIEGILGGAVDWVKSHWDILLTILTGPFGLAVMVIKDHGGQILNFIGSLPGRIAGIASGMWDSMWQGFRWAINKIISLWNGLGFTLPSVDWGPVHIGGGHIGVPQIPYMAQGGVALGPTLALIGEAGPEAVVPLGSSAAAGAGFGGDITINVPVVVDSRVIAQVTARHTRDELIKMRRSNPSGPSL